LADALDALLRPGIPVSIPDAVYVEATRVRRAAGASRIVEWINKHLDRVRIVPSEVGVDQQRRIEESRTIRALGEQAALEVLGRFLIGDPEAEALLLFEDTDIARRRAIVDERVSLVSTGDFCGNSKRRISSNRRQVTSDTNTRDRFRHQLQRRDDDPKTQ
jgi:hypothetical protein